MNPTAPQPTEFHLLIYVCACIHAHAYKSLLPLTWFIGDRLQARSGGKGLSLKQNRWNSGKMQVMMHLRSEDAFETWNKTTSRGNAISNACATHHDWKNQVSAQVKETAREQYPLCFMQIVSLNFEGLRQKHTFWCNRVKHAAHEDRQTSRHLTKRF